MYNEVKAIPFISVGENQGFDLFDFVNKRIEFVLN